MDVSKLYCTKHWLEYSSFSFNLENYVILTNSLLLLQNENHFKKTFFWGVIHGLEADYYISFGYKSDAIVDRTYFYCDDYQNWKLLPEPQPEHIALADLCRIPFQGDPSLVIEVVDDAPPEELVSDSDYDKETNAPEEDMAEVQEQIVNGIPTDNNVWYEESNQSVETNRIEEGNQSKEANQSEDANQSDEAKRESKISQVDQLSQKSKSSIITSGELKEEDRLAAVIKIISEETAVIPRGGLFKQTDGTHVHSRAFDGLSLEDADELCSFQHYRLPQQDWNTNLLARVDYNYAIDFLDTIDKDIPSDCWSGQLMEGDRVIVLRNLIWPEFMFFHHLETPDHGCVYVGYGQRNLDVPFMTQIGEKIEIISLEEKISSRLMHAIGTPLLDEDKRGSSASVHAIDTPSLAEDRRGSAASGQGTPSLAEGRTGGSASVNAIRSPSLAEDRRRSSVSKQSQHTTRSREP